MEGLAGRRLHLLGLQARLLHAVGQPGPAFVQTLDPVGLEVDGAGDVLDTLHVCPAETCVSCGVSQYDSGDSAPQPGACVWTA